MEAKITYCYSLLLLLLAIVNGHGAWGISIEEEIELESELRIQGIPGLKSITMRPSSFPEPSTDDFPMMSEYEEVGFREGCPLGTVPIRRIPKEDKRRAKAFLKTYSEQLAKDSMQPLEEPGAYFKAEVHTQRKRTSKYYGAQAFLNVYNPKLTTDQQFSRIMMKLRYGPEDSSTSLEVGWAVFPALYNDTFTRLHTFWSVDYHHRSCMDALCMGFVQVSSKIPLGMKISHVSTYLGKQYDLKLTVFKDPKSGHWWLLYGRNSEPVGYWPEDLLGDFTSHITEGKWGGDVYGLFAPLPPMGSGHKFEESRRGGYRSACYIRGIKVQEQLGGKFLDVDEVEIEEREDIPMCYTVEDQGMSSSWGYTIYVGGSGGLCYW
ncbi:hypothetical protein AAG906_027390 [Vitis piasezkii]